MSVKEIIYAVFYTGFLILALCTGIKFGYTDSHTPPMPFIVELFTLLIGLILFFIDVLIGSPPTFKKLRVHVFGLLANACVMAFVLFF